MIVKVWERSKLLINMVNFFKYKRKNLFFVVIGILVVISIVAWQNYPFGVKQYKTISLGMTTPEIVGDGTGWAPPDDVVPESDFYVYALGDESFCIGSSCGIGAYFVECLGGWISGYTYDAGEVDDYGLYDAGIDIGEQTIITVADKEGKIVGIYPGALIRNLPYIMRNHKDLVSAERFKECSDLLPQRWK